MAEYESKFTEQWLPVGDLDIDRTIQRFKLDNRKVERIVRKFNPAAPGVITVSKRGPVTYIVLDGMHRVEAVRRLTDNQGTILAHVFEDLSEPEEAQMFLDLNAGNQPNIIEKFLVRQVAEDPTALEIARIVGAYGWKVRVGHNVADIQCVGTLERIYLRSEKKGADPNYLQLAIMVITHAWGMEPEGVHAAVVEGIAAMFEEYGDTLDPSTLERKMKSYKGGPKGLHTAASTLASTLNIRVPMAVADILVGAYNKGLKGKALYPFRRRV